MKFDKVLIANRGEIACRVIETARAMGIRTVAVYSDADATARHVAIADEAVRIGPASPAESYLRGEKIILSALESDADAIHPGYGFLSENPEFVEAVEAAGLIFVGPSAKAIRAMGLKDAAKAIMEQAGVPVVPGYQGADQGDAHLAAEADRIGYPVMIKAVAGGGGKGMRAVERPDDFASALSAARAEAMGAFGNDVVLIEKLIGSPRHIEVQIFGDGEKAVHLFERDCSLQRRHQKVIEEAPAPGMTDDVRAAMGAAAVRAAEAVGYKSAGTVEFIVDASDGLKPDRFWFMEMNTRLQVEHPVTEAITGVDLVEWQLRVAQGESLPVPQELLAVTGHSIEARLYAEDAAAGFLPATGRLEHLVFPDLARIDTGVRQGDSITPFYDPMIAKITVHGSDRTSAIGKLARALEATEIAGTVTNLGFLRRLTAHEHFQSGDVDTGLIDRDSGNLAADPPLSEAALAVAAVVSLGLGAEELQGFTLWAPQRQQLTLANREIEVVPTTTGANISIGSNSLSVAADGGGWRVDGEAERFRAVKLEGSVEIFGANGGRVAVSDPLARGTGEDTSGMALAPMPGQVTLVAVEKGEKVAKGDTLAVLEAMKMEHRLVAARDGVVADILARTGDQVEAGAALVRLAEAET
ncbi:MAG: acetyl/propionyl/methylcrotonyl-CoA carboxylase subunit alpha [Boseongicola sp.]